MPINIANPTIVQARASNIIIVVTSFFLLDTKRLPTPAGL